MDEVSKEAIKLISEIHNTLIISKEEAKKIALLIVAEHILEMKRMRIRFFICCLYPHKRIKFYEKMKEVINGI